MRLPYDLLKQYHALKNYLFFIHKKIWSKAEQFEYDSLKV